MANKLENAGPPLSDRDLDEAAARIGLALPASLRAQYKVADGGRPTKRYFLDADGNDYEVNALRRVKHRVPGVPLLAETYEMLVQRKQLMPRHFIPFGSDSGGDLYCIHANTGAIFFWAADRYEPGEPESALSEIAPSLEAFLEGMVTEKEALGS
jgi:cell wall assembly regulator SMI1